MNPRNTREELVEKINGVLSYLADDKGVTIAQQALEKPSDPAYRTLFLFSSPQDIVMANKKNIEGLIALQKAISGLTEHDQNIPSQEWLKGILDGLVIQYPQLSTGFHSKKLLVEIAPVWHQAFEASSKRSCSII